MNVLDRQLLVRMAASSNTGRLNIPIFGGDKSYGRWLEEIKAWKLTTAVEKKKQALTIALALPEGSEVRRRIFEESGSIEELNVDDGVAKLITRLDKWYKEDDLSAAYGAWTNFDTYKKIYDVTMDNYISEFMRRNNELTKHDVKIPNSILAFKMLDNAGLDFKEKQIALTAVSFDDKNRMLELMQQSLKKFFGSQEVFSEKLSACSAVASNMPSIAIKSEPVYTAEEVNVTQRDGRGSYYRGNVVNRGRSRGRNFGYGRGGFKDSSFSSTKNSFGKKCYSCGSEYHLSPRCPRNTYVSESEEGKESKEYESYVCYEETFNVQNGSKLMKEAIDYGILDTACTSTVCGMEWLNMYIRGLTSEERIKIKEETSESTFRFGDGRVYESLKKVILPIKIAGIDWRITTDVVECYIPLLISKKSMKKAHMKINLENDTALLKVGKKYREVKLDCTSSGHYRLALQDPEKIRRKVEEIEEILITLGQDGNEKRKNIKKLHHQFGHPSIKRLRQLLIDAKIEDNECHSLIEEITNGCDTCLKFKRTPSRPIVTMNMASEMNDIVALDLKEYKKNDIYFLHMIDLATRFSRTCITRSKDPKVIVECIITTWLGSGLGAPRKFLCDNGGEFSNNTLLDLCKNMNIEVMHTSAYSPFSNGICERNHAVIDDMVYKIKADQPDLNLEIAVAWAVNAKNCLQMVGGFSPFQLVYGRNPRLPGVMDDDLPALEGTSSEEVIARHLNASLSARKAFISAQASEKIRRALKGNVRQSRKIFTDGDKVYFKRPDRKEWSGPATVIGKDGKTVLLKYGAHIVRCHETHVQEIPYSFERDTEKGRKDLLEMLKNNHPEKSKEDNENEGEEYEEEISTHNEDNSHNSLQKAIVFDTIPKIGQKVKFRQKDGDDWKVGTILSRAGKVTGKYKNWRNVVSDDGSIVAMDWLSQVDRWEPLHSEENSDEESEEESQHSDEDITVNEVLMASTKDNDLEKKVEIAKEMELESWRNFNVYKEVKNEGQKAVSVRWVITEKDGLNAKRMKARLVARGFEEKEEIKSDSPTVSKEVLRTFITICSSMGWSANSIDIKAAFLQSEGIGREVYLIPPTEAKCDENILWKLEKCVYGLNDAARKWYLTVKTFLLKMNCIQLKTDPAAFYCYQNGKLSGIFLMHVDDFLWGGTEWFENTIVAKIRKQFRVREQNCNIFKYIGMNIEQCDNGIVIHQNEFCKTLQVIQINPLRKHDKDLICTNKEKEMYRGLVGQLGWLCTNSRPDLSFDVLELSCKVNSPKIGDLIDANKCLKKACMFESSMYFPKLNDLNNCKIIVYSDASHANLPNGVSSAGGFIIFLADNKGNVCPLYWESRKIRRVVKSTLAAETLAAADAIDNAYYLGEILSEILFRHGKDIPIELYVDNKSLHDNVFSVKNVAEKRLRIDIAAIKELVTEEKLNVNWVETKCQLADGLTKKGVNPIKLSNVFQTGFLEV